MNRRTFLLSASLSFAIAGATSVHAQQPNRIATIGVLMSAADQNDPLVEALRRGMREVGYVEGRNLRFEFRTSRNHPDRLPALARELAERKVDLIVVSSTAAARAAKEATPNIPIVTALIADPVVSGLADSLSHPGGNVTGLSLMTAELSAKVMQLLKETFPRLTRVAVLWNFDTPLSPVQTKIVEELKAAASSLSIELLFLSGQTPEQFETAFAAASRAHVQAVYVGDSPQIYVGRVALVRSATKAGLPTIFRTRAFPEAGGLMSYGPNWFDHVRRSAVYVDKILKGAKAGDLPIEQPTKFELVVNLKTTKTLGVAIPESILSRADEVIK